MIKNCSLKKCTSKNISILLPQKRYFKIAKIALLSSKIDIDKSLIVHNLIDTIRLLLKHY